MLDDDECGAVGGIKIGRRNRSTQRKPSIKLQNSQVYNNQNS
jgi:hypothetical protein